MFKFKINKKNITVNLKNKLTHTSKIKKNQPFFLKKL